MTKTTEEFIQDAYCKHPDRYNYRLVDYKNSKTKIKIICPIHGIFEQRPANHLRCLCPDCSKMTIKEKLCKTVEKFIQEAYCKHGDDYNYKLVDYKNSKTKVKIICHNHGIFEQRPANHLNGQRCPECYGTSKKSSNDFIKSNIKDGNGDIDTYTYVDYKNNKTKITLVCPIHGRYDQYPNDHQYKKCGCPKCTSHISKAEQELQEWISQYIDIDTSVTTVINPYELDIIIPSKKIAIEYNGLYWHSEQKGRGDRYHLNKYNLCKDKGYRLIQVWENEWLSNKDIVKSIILNAIGQCKDRVHGRKTTIRTVDPREARPFYDNNHIQGFKGGEHHGLYYNNELVSLMTIDKRGELQRFVNKKFTIVHGAFSKLLKSFNHNDIYTFADLRYFTGDVYRNNGFKEVHLTKPNYYYFMTRDNTKVYHRRGFQKKGIGKRLEKFNPNLTEYQNMLINGYDRIWDCGNLKFQYKKPPPNI